MPLTAKEYEELMAEAEAKLERLRGTYEQYFQGLERIEPNIQKKKVERLFFQLVQEKPRGSTIRFRANQLIQKWSTYQMYWRRVCRQIEEGTFRRHVERAKKHKERLEKEKGGRRSLRTGAGKDAAPQEGPKSIELDMDLNIELDMNEFANELTRDPDPLPASAAGELPFVTERPAPRAVADDDEATGARVAAVAAPTSSAKAPYKPPAPKLPPGLGAKPAVAPAPKLSPAPAAQAPAPAANRLPPPGVTPLAATPKKPAAPPPPPMGGLARKPPAPPPAAPARAAASPAPPTPKGSTVGDADVRRVYERYVEARKNNNERVDNVKFEKVKDQIAKMLPDLEKKHQGKKIDFDVVVKDGKVGIKPVAK